MSEKWEWLGDVAPFLPPAFGALLGVGWAKNQTPVQKVFSFFAGFGLAVYFAPAITEFFTLGPKATVAVSILTAIVGMDIIGGFIAAGNQFKSDPMGAFKGWLDTWRGR